MAGLLIADCSNNNGTINFDTIRKAGVGAVWLKATEGVTVNDRDYKQFRAQAKASKLRVGAYHFAHPELHDPWVEAGHFATVIGKPQRTDLRPVLDFEVRYGAPSIKQWSWAHAFGQALKQHIGAFPIFYSYQALIKELNWTTTVGEGLWLAKFDDKHAVEPWDVPRPWKKDVAHQFTESWHVAGHEGSFDLSYAPSTKAVLAHPWLGLVK